MTAQEIHLESALSCEEASGGWKRVSKRSEMDKMLEEMKQNDLDRQERKDQYHQQQKKTKRRQIDDFLQEIKGRYSDDSNEDFELIMCVGNHYHQMWMKAV